MAAIPMTPQPNRAHGALLHQYAEVNGVRLHYVAAGAGKLMLFVHGFPQFWYAWHELLPEFARDYCVVAPDTRGINLSGKPEGVKTHHPTHQTEEQHQMAQAASDETRSRAASGRPRRGA